METFEIVIQNLNVLLQNQEGKKTIDTFTLKAENRSEGLAKALDIAENLYPDVKKSVEIRRI